MRRKHEVVDGAHISCWDCPQFADRYTVVYLDDSPAPGWVSIACMSAAPFRPQGIGMHGEMPLNAVQCKGRGGVFDKRIRFADLPADCQILVRLDIAAMKEDHETA